MSVGDSAEEFIMIHALGRKIDVACVILWCSVKFAENLFFARCETIESVGLLHTSHRMCF